MSDYFSVDPICKKCGAVLDDDENSPALMMPIGGTIKLNCPTCRIEWLFWLTVETRQKEIKAKKSS